jgi:hypothetical protein
VEGFDTFGFEANLRAFRRSFVDGATFVQRISPVVKIGSLIPETHVFLLLLVLTVQEISDSMITIGMDIVVVLENGPDRQTRSGGWF